MSGEFLFTIGADDETTIAELRKEVELWKDRCDALQEWLERYVPVDFARSRRRATGPLKCGDDWAGVFIRGDEALGYAHALRLLGTVPGVDPAWAIEGSQLGGLIKLLESCREERK